MLKFGVIGTSKKQIATRHDDGNLLDAFDIQAFQPPLRRVQGFQAARRHPISLMDHAGKASFSDHNQERFGIISDFMLQILAKHFVDEFHLGSVGSLCPTIPVPIVFLKQWTEAG